MSHGLDEFFVVESHEFEVEFKDLVYLKDPQAFFDHIVAERGLDRKKFMVGLDG